MLCRGTQAGGLGVALGLVGVTAGPGPACSSVSSGVEEGRLGCRGRHGGGPGGRLRHVLGHQGVIA